MNGFHHLLQSLSNSQHEWISSLTPVTVKQSAWMDFITHSSPCQTVSMNGFHHSLQSLSQSAWMAFITHSVTVKQSAWMDFIMYSSPCQTVSMNGFHHSLSHCKTVSMNGFHHSLSQSLSNSQHEWISSLTPVTVKQSAWMDVIIHSVPVKHSSLTQGIDAVAKCQKGSVDVSSFHHPFAAVVSVSRTLRPSKVNEKEFARAHLLHHTAGATALLDNHLQDGMGSRGGCVGSRGFLCAFSVPLYQHLHHLKSRCHFFFFYINTSLMVSEVSQFSGYMQVQFITDQGFSLYLH